MRSYKIYVITKIVETEYCGIANIRAAMTLEAAEEMLDSLEIAERQHLKPGEFVGEDKHLYIHTFSGDRRLFAIQQLGVCP